MKKWDEPQLVELSLENTKAPTCNVEDFEAIGKLRSPGAILCDKEAYTPRDPANFNFVCIYHGSGKWCNYTGQQQS